MEAVHTVRIDHGPVQTTAMSYSQRQPSNHRPTHNQQTELYKPPRSPLSTSRYPYPASPQLQTQVTPVSNQRYTVPPSPAVFTSGYRDYRHPRISLLHPEYTARPRESLQGGGIHHLEGIPNQGQQPFKKIRLQDHKDIQPLRIDTREQPGAYNPQVEAISPTLPEHIQQEDQAFRTTKDELLQQIGKVDREIAKAESQISILKKKQQELEEVASKPSVKSEVEEDTQPKHQSLAQKIYAENRKKAQNAHAKLDTLGPKVEWPIYNQPSDTAVYHENKRKNIAFKRRLLEYFKNRHVEKESRNTYLTETYSKLMQEWLRKVDKIESSTKRKAKEAKNREFFEKVFPELRKQREDKERFNRVGARIKSEADLEEIMDNLQEQALEDKKMRSYAVIPPILLDAKERKVVYQNDNGVVEDMEAVYKSRQFLNVWTPSEKEVFKEKYLQHPKNFGLVASYLDRKSVADCVQYYYLSKKTENYKQLLRKSRQKTRSSRNNPQKVNSSANASAADFVTTGVTTRLQREQQQKTVVQQAREPPSDVPVTSSTVGATTTTVAVSTATSTTTIASVSTGATTTTTSRNSANSTSPAPTTVSTPTTTAATLTSVISSVNSTLSTTTTTAAVTSVVTSTASTTIQQIKSPNSAENVGDSKGFNEFNSSDEYRVKGKYYSDDVKSDNASASEGGNTDVQVQGILQIKKENDPVQEANSDKNSIPNAVVENKKKKERRKDKENAAMETSDDDAPDLQDKTIQGQCIVCSSQLGPQLQSRPLVPSQASQYGLREDQIPPNGRVCNTCRCKCVRSRYTHCPLPSCPNSRGRVKRLRSFPQRLQDLPSDVREQLLSEFHVPSGVTKCCSACFNRIQRRLGPIEEWSEEEINQLRGALTELGANWQLVGEHLNKSAHQVRSYYAANRKRLNLETCLGDRKPTLTDEEESGSSTSSCEDPIRDINSSDTASAESPPVIQEQPQNIIRKEDYDSSATETADEGQTPDHYQSATITPVNNTDGQQQPLTVKDLMLNVIELSLKKNTGGQQQQQHPPTSGMTPTISSILNNDPNEVTIVSEYNLNNQQRPQQQQRNDLSLAKLVTPLIAATITPVPPVVVQETNDLVVLQDGRDTDNITLDLSIKKPRELPPPPAHSKHPQIHRNETYVGYHQQERKSPAVYVSAIPRNQQKMPSPKPANTKAGSITLGTPIVSQPRYEGLLRQMTPDPKMGSITQGTPIHVPHIHDKRVYEYYNKRPVPQNVPPQGTYTTQYRQPAYSVEQQLSSRQIIMNDYITSQQMLGRRNDKPQYYPASSPHRTPPPPQQQQQQQQRQGVIQRHNTRPHYPPGHEALSSLVDVAVQQPSLPVPTAPHEGLGKTIADNILEQPHRFQMMQHQQQQQMRLMEAERRRYHQQQQQQQQQQVRQQQQQQQQVARNESSTLTAASLIDAIITHQINQSEGNREVMSNSREPPRPGDRLFQSFHRDQPAPQQQQQNQDSNGERSPSVISVDLDSDTINKNLTVKELTDSVISHDFSTRQPFYHHQENVNEQWKRRLQQQQQQQQQKEETKRSATPQQDERQIIRIAQPQKYHVEPVSPPEGNHWPEQNYRRYQPPVLEYMKNRIVEAMRTEDDKKDTQDGGHGQDKDMSNSPGEMVIDEEKHEDYSSGTQQQQQQQQPTQQQQSGFAYPFVAHKESTANDSTRNVEPKPLLSAQYEPLSDED